MNLSPILSPTNSNSKISSYHSYFQITSLAYNKSDNSILYKVLCLTHKSLKTGHPSDLRSLLCSRSHLIVLLDRSSSLITLNRPAVYSSLKMSNRSFFHSALHGLVEQSTFTPSSFSSSLHFFTSPISVLSTSVFLKKLKSHLFRISFPP